MVNPSNGVRWKEPAIVSSTAIFFTCRTVLSLLDPHSH
jgi:hypothetical protein